MMNKVAMAIAIMLCFNSVKAQEIKKVKVKARRKVVRYTNLPTETVANKEHTYFIKLFDRNGKEAPVTEYVKNPYLDPVSAKKDPGIRDYLQDCKYDMNNPTYLVEIRTNSEYLTTGESEKSIYKYKNKSGDEIKMDVYNLPIIVIGSYNLTLKLNDEEKGYPILFETEFDRQTSMLYPKDFNKVRPGLSSRKSLDDDWASVKANGESYDRLSGRLDQLHHYDLMVKSVKSYLSPRIAFERTEIILPFVRFNSKDMRMVELDSAFLLLKDGLDSLKQYRKYGKPTYNWHYSSSRSLFLEAIAKYQLAFDSEIWKDIKKTDVSEEVRRGLATNLYLLYSITADYEKAKPYKEIAIGNSSGMKGIIKLLRIEVTDLDPIFAKEITYHDFFNEVFYKLY